MNQNNKNYSSIFHIGDKVTDKQNTDSNSIRVGIVMYIYPRLIDSPLYKVGSSILDASKLELYSEPETINNIAKKLKNKDSDKIINLKNKIKRMKKELEIKEAEYLYNRYSNIYKQKAIKIANKANWSSK